MSTINLIIEERATQIGSFLVGRLLPFRQKRTIGPFIYIDHMGPVTLSPSENFDVLPHPHIGLSTLTYLLQGSIMHRDSIGTSTQIHPGAVNFMTAGSGIVHSERTPDALRHTTKHMHGLQIWIALPAAHEDTTPNFSHTPAADLPGWSENGAEFQLIAGQIPGHQSPVPVYSPLYMIEIKSTTPAQVQIGHLLYGESGLYVLQGGVEVGGQTYHEKQLLVSLEPSLCGFTLFENSIVYIFGGEPFPEERFIDWNFVSSSSHKIEEAKAKWIARQFPTIPGDDVEFAPYPVRK